MMGKFKCRHKLSVAEVLLPTLYTHVYIYIYIRVCIMLAVILQQQIIYDDI